MEKQPIVVTRFFLGFIPIKKKFYNLKRAEEYKNAVSLVHGWVSIYYPKTLYEDYPEANK